jgi:hypothetical protein
MVLAKNGVAAILDKGNMVPTGSSPTMGKIIKWNDAKYFAKISVHYNPKDILDQLETCHKNLGLLYEKYVYETALRDAYPLTRCLVKYVTTLTLPTIGLPNTREKVLRAAKSASECDTNNTVALDVMVTEYIDKSMTMYAFVHKQPESVRRNLDFGPVMAQIVATLVLLENFGIQHNDLHMGNVLCSLQAPFRTYGKHGAGRHVGGKHNILAHTDESTPVRISEVWLQMYIFDWDFSFATGYKKNPRITHFKDRCSFVNSSKDVNSILDLYTFRMDLLRFTKNNEPLTDFAEEIFPNYEQTMQKITQDEMACDGHLPKSLQKQAVAPRIWQNGIKEVLNCSYIKPYVRFLVKGTKSASPRGPRSPRSPRSQKSAKSLGTSPRSRKAPRVSVQVPRSWRKLKRSKPRGAGEN